MTWSFYNKRGVKQQDGFSDLIPIGLITSFVSQTGPTPTVPNGWLLCDGSVLSTTTEYTELATLLAYPAAPGVTFTLPNLNTKFSIGASGSYPVKSSGGTAQHPHSIPLHTHTNQHQHTVSSNHKHSADHKHNRLSDGTSHRHGAGSYSLDNEAGSDIYGLITGGGSTVIPRGPDSAGNNGHTHDITSITGYPSDVTLLNMNNSVDSGDGGANTSGAESTLLKDAASTISPAGDILPPYLNVYFIIKAKSLEGSYI